jgi:hypothetical protein
VKIRKFHFPRLFASLRAMDDCAHPKSLAVPTFSIEVTMERTEFHSIRHPPSRSVVLLSSSRTLRGSASAHRGMDDLVSGITHYFEVSWPAGWRDLA